MRIATEAGTHEVGSEAEVEQILRARNSAGMNEFTIFETEESYPLLIVLTNRNYAYLYYIETERGNSYQSVGHLPELDPDGNTTFYWGREYQEYDNRSVVSFDVSLRAVKEFFATKQLPGCMEWIKAS
jgi:hypothetical protein